MKAILKVIWFALAILLLDKFGNDIIPSESINKLSDQINSFVPEKLFSLQKIYNQTYEKLLFLVALFLGLDIISGDIKGIIKGPIKLVLNTILYVIGFTTVFVFLDFAVTF